MEPLGLGPGGRFHGGWREESRSASMPGWPGEVMSQGWCGKYSGGGGDQINAQSRDPADVPALLGAGLTQLS